MAPLEIRRTLSLEPLVRLACSFQEVVRRELGVALEEARVDRQKNRVVFSFYRVGKPFYGVAFSLSHAKESFYGVVLSLLHAVFSFYSVVNSLYGIVFSFFRAEKSTIKAVREAFELVVSLERRSSQGLVVRSVRGVMPSRVLNVRFFFFAPLARVAHVEGEVASGKFLNGRLATGLTKNAKKPRVVRGSFDMKVWPSDRVAVSQEASAMGSNIPSQPKIDQIVWFENHLPLWTAIPTAFGVPTAQITALNAAVTAARGAYNAAQAARQTSKNATTAETMQVGTMLTLGRDTVNVMKAFIKNSNNGALWAQAGLEPSATSGSAADPVAPTSLSATLDSQGNVIVKWKTSQPAGVSGVIYSVRRSVDGGAFTLLDSVGGKMFTDETVAIGTQSVSYALKAKRGTQASEWSESLTIRFGRVGGASEAESLFIASSESSPVKMAA